MGKVLTQEQIEHYHREGYLFPLDGISKDRCNELLAGVERFEKEHGVNPGLFKL